MHATGPRTIRPPETSSLAPDGAQGSGPESEQGGVRALGNSAEGGNASNPSPLPSVAARVAGHDGDVPEHYPVDSTNRATGGGRDDSQAQRHPSQITNDTATAGQASGERKTNASPTTGNKHAQFEAIAGRGGYENLNYKIRRAHKLHTYQYWFVAVSSNSLLFLQVLIAASLTALGAFNDRRARTATIFLGATNTIIAALLTYFKTRNQPNRARQLRNDLGRVVDQLDDAEASLRMADAPDDVTTAIKGIRDSYRQARADAEANYPDLWVRAGDLRSPFSPDRVADPSTPAPPAPSATQGQPPQPRQPGQRAPEPGAFMTGARTDPGVSNTAGAGRQNTG